MSCIRDSSKEHKGSGHTHVSCDAILAIIADFYKNDEDVDDQFINGMSVHDMEGLEEVDPSVGVVAL